MTLRNNNVETYAVDSVTNQYDASGTYTVTHTYDEAGNLAADHRGYVYTYDYENRLIKIQEGANPVVEYAYDALGRRSMNAVYGDETYLYYYDSGWRVLAEYLADDVTTMRKRYVYGNYLDEVLMVAGYYDYYYAHDHLYSPVALLSFSGGILERYEYDAYGRRNVFENDFDARSGSHYGLAIAFTGQRLDVLDGEDLEVMYYKNRCYDVEMGRFLTRDPIGYADGMNLYQYVQNSPLMILDALGLYGPEMHRDMTNSLAELAGLCGEWGDYATEPDENPDMGGPPPHEVVWSHYLLLLHLWDGDLANERLHAVADYHFPQDENGNVRPAINPGDNPVVDNLLDQAGCDAQQFGNALHALQDSFSHVDPAIGIRLPDGSHIRVGHSNDRGGPLSGQADDTGQYPEDAARAARATYAAMQDFREECGNNCNGECTPPPADNTLVEQFINSTFGLPLPNNLGFENLPGIIDDLNHYPTNPQEFKKWIEERNRQMIM